MARHPGLQHQNRMRELTDKLTSANMEAMSDLGTVKDLENQVYKARAAAHVTERKAKRLADFMARMVKDARDGGITDWGLPRTVSMEEWEELVGKPSSSDSFYWDKEKAEWEERRRRKEAVLADAAAAEAAAREKQDLEPLE